MTTPLVIERPALRLWSGKPVVILGDAKKAALKAGVSLAWWVEFSTTFRACLTPDCLPEEMAKSLEVVKERFVVTMADGFTLDLPKKEATDGE